MSPASILLIEDDPGAGTALQKVLRGEGYRVTLVPRGDDGLQRALSEPFDLVLTDLRLPGLDGLQLLVQLRAHRPKLPVILLTAHGDTHTAIEATKHGACEYLNKPCDAEELLGVVEAAVEQSRRMSDPVELGDSPDASRFAIVGRSRAMQALYKEIGRVAAAPVPVLIRGATGAGKELVARALYQYSDRSGHPFIAINCAALPPTLIESELFGHERGAFTGAHARRIGRFEQAHRGTLFLDEIGDLPVETQAKLLRVLQDRCLQRVGGNEWIPVDVRILAATHRDLEAAIAAREFREDLFFRLSVVTLRLPSLRERPEDIPELVRYFIRRYAHEFNITQPSIQPEAVEFLASQSWPGNVRELENVVRQALLRARPFPVGLEMVRQAVEASAPRPVLPESPHAAYVTELLERVQRGEVADAHRQMIRDLEPELFRQALQRAGGNQAQAARWLGITRLKLRERLLDLGLHPRQSASDDPEP